MIKVIKRVISCLVVAAALIMVNKILVYILVDDAENEIRYAMHELYQQEDIDSLFLGSSLVFCGYDPDVMDNAWGGNTYLAATPVQKVDGSYYLLKEVIKKNELKTVYVDVFYRHFRDVPQKRTPEQMEYIYCITDYMENSKERIDFLLHASGMEQYVRSFCVPSRYGNYLLDLKRFERVIKSKRSETYVNGEKPENFYKGAMFTHGQIGNAKRIGKLDEYNFAYVKDEAVSEYSLEYLDKIVKLCKEENIRLVLVATPITDLFIQAIGNYDIYHNYMKEYAQQNEIEFYDFNLCKVDVLEFQNEDFMDTIHLSGVGNEKYSKVFAQVMLMEEEEREDLFYLSVEEKKKALPKQSFGITYQENEEKENSYLLDVIANYDLEAEYRISLVDEEGNETRVIQDFDKNNEIIIEENSSYQYKIVVRDAITKEICEEVVETIF